MKGMETSSDTRMTIAFLLALCAWIRSGKVFPASVKRDLPKYQTAIESWLKKYNISVKGVAPMVKAYGTDVDDADEAAELIIANLREKWKAVQRDTSISQDEVAIIKDCALYLAKDSQPAYQRLRSNCTKVCNVPDIIGGFRTEIKVPKAAKQQVQRLVERMTGMPGTVIPLDKLAAARAKYPTAYAQYLDLRRELTSTYRAALQNMCREKGDAKGTVNVEDAKKYMQTLGLDHDIPDGFVGRIDEYRALYTSAGIPLNERPNYPVKMNPEYDPQKDNRTNVGICTLPTKDKNDKFRIQHLYTQTYKAISTDTKYEIVKVMLTNEKKYRKKWVTDLRSPDMGKNKICGALVELSYQTCNRIGTPGNASKAGATFGLSTLRVGDVKKRGTSRMVGYSGKKSVEQKFTVKPDTIESREIIWVLDTLCANRRRTDLLFWYDGAAVSASVVRDYWKRITGLDIGMHKIRTMRGTALATDILQELGAKLSKKTNISQTEVEKQFKDSLVEVGELLGHVRGMSEDATTHTWSTASESYIDPDVQFSFFEGLAAKGIRVPKFITKLRKNKAK